jgi:hypothetical protein
MLAGFKNWKSAKKVLFSVKKVSVGNIGTAERFSALWQDPMGDAISSSGIRDTFVMLPDRS